MIERICHRLVKTLFDKGVIENEDVELYEFAAYSFTIQFFF